MLVACEHSKTHRLEDIKLDASEVYVDAQDASTTSLPCSSDMQLVDGLYCPAVEQKCLRWLDIDKRPEANGGIGPMRCALFAPSKCLSKTRKHIRVCVDTYEWPNKKFEFPLVTIDWYGAKSKCESIGKRLCTAEEWTFTCEGEEIKPYPYGDGLHRDATTCVIDRPSMNPLLPRSEWPKHNLSEASGVMSNCVSPYGVHDMTGNVDEWVHNVGGKKDGDPYFSGLKGGYFGPVRNRCRPMTTVHNPWHSFYQQGFRCCKDAL